MVDSGWGWLHHCSPTFTHTVTPCEWASERHRITCINMSVRPRLMSCESCLKCGAYVICVMLLANSCTHFQYCTLFWMGRECQIAKMSGYIELFSFSHWCDTHTHTHNGRIAMRRRQLLWWHKSKGEILLIFRRVLYVFIEIQMIGYWAISMLLSLIQH